MDYSNWTDFAINAAVGAATGEAKNSEPLLSLVIRNSNGRRFDPCNNPADAWPIIVGNRIALMPDASEHGSHKWWDAQSSCQTHGIQYQANPLRAAMVVFLMMKESD